MFLCWSNFTSSIHQHGLTIHCTKSCDVSFQDFMIYDKDRLIIWIYFRAYPKWYLCYKINKLDQVRIKQKCLGWKWYQTKWVNITINHHDQSIFQKRKYIFSWSYLMHILFHSYFFYKCIYKYEWIHTLI